METLEQVKLAYDAISDKKGEDIKVLDISEISVLADYFVIAHGNNQNQVKTIADSVEKKLSENGIALKHREGHHTSTWILLDFGDFIVHIFKREEREFYNLEHVWADAKLFNF